MTSPQYGYQPYSEAAEGIAITTQYSAAFTPFFGAVRPKIVVNGKETPVWGCGRTVLPLAPGQYDGSQPRWVLCHKHAPTRRTQQASVPSIVMPSDPDAARDSA